MGACIMQRNRMQGFGLWMAARTEEAGWIVRTLDRMTKSECKKFCFYRKSLCDMRIACSYLRAWAFRHAMALHKCRTSANWIEGAAT